MPSAPRQPEDNVAWTGSAARGAGATEEGTPAQPRSQRQQAGVGAASASAGARGGGGAAGEGSEALAPLVVGPVGVGPLGPAQSSKLSDYILPPASGLGSQQAAVAPSGGAGAAAALIHNLGVLSPPPPPDAAPPPPPHQYHQLAALREQLQAQAAQAAQAGHGGYGHPHGGVSMMGDYFGGMPLPRKKAANKIFVGGLHWETTDEKLRKHFMLFGEVIDAVVMKDPISRRSRGFGFITFADAAAVDRVLSQDNHILDSRRVEAKRAVPRSETLLKQQHEPLMQPPTPPTRPLPASALMGLQQHMHGMGGGLQGIIPQQSSSSSAAAAAAVLMGGGGQGFSAGPPPLPLPPPYHQMGGPGQHGGLGGHGPSGMGVGMGMGMGGLSSTHKIFVGGLHYETKDAEFRAYFERFGHVISAEVMFNRETHKSRGFGFVVFEDEAAVERVLQLPQHAIDGKMVEVKRAIPRNQVASPIMGASAAGLGGGLPGGPPRGLSPSFTTGSGLGPAGGLGGGKYPPALSLDKGGPGQGRPAHSPSSYAQAVLQQRGGRAIHGGHPGGDLAALAEEMGGMSLQGKQRQQQETLLGALAAGQGAGAGQWTGLEHLLETMEGQQAAQQQQQQQQHYEAAMREQAQYLLAQQQQQQQGAHMPPGLDPTEPYGSTAVGQQHHSAHHPGAGQGQQGAHRPMDSRYNFASAGPGGAGGEGAGAGAGQPGGSGGGNEGLLWPAGPPRHYPHTGEAPPQPQQPKAGSAPATPHLHGMPPPGVQEMPPPLGSAGSIPGRPPAEGGPGSGGRRTLSWEAILYPGAEGARGAAVADGAGEGPPSASSSSSQAGLPSHY